MSEEEITKKENEEARIELISSMLITMHAELVHLKKRVAELERKNN